MSSIKWIRYSLSLYCRAPVHLVFLVVAQSNISLDIFTSAGKSILKKNHMKTYCRRLETKVLRNSASIFDSLVIATLFLKTNQAVEFLEVTPGVTYMFAHTQCIVYNHSLIRSVLPTKSKKSFISTNLLEAVISISVNIKDFCVGHLTCSIQTPSVKAYDFKCKPFYNYESL